MTLLNCSVKHTAWGLGIVEEQTGNSVMVRFVEGALAGEEKRFQYPEAFEKYLKCEDDNVQKAIEAEIALKVQKEEARKEEEKRKQEEHRRMIEKTNTNVKVFKSENQKNVAFKCNFCNGGKMQNGVGFCGVCSDTVIEYNIKVAKHTWCSHEDSPCRKYYNGRINRKTLDREMENGGWVCYESRMLRDWIACAGTVLTKENEGKTKKMRDVREGSLAILTSRERYMDEKSRFIFGVFLIDEYFEGDEYDSGYVMNHSKYRIKLSQREANRILFWNYYQNRNKSDKPLWGQGLYRHISDLESVGILYDIWQVKRGTKDEALVKEFFEYFCKLKKIDPKLLACINRRQMK